MFVNILVFIILFQLKRIGMTFVSIGDYSDSKIPDLNNPECGLSITGFVYQISYTKCFKKVFKNRTIIDIKWKKSDSLNKSNRRLPSQPLERVLNGKDSDRTDTPYTVLIQPTSWHRLSEGRCTGVLLTYQWILTAAHCFNDWKEWYDPYLSSFYVSAPAETKKQTQKTTFDKWYEHPVWKNQTLDSDQQMTEQEKELRKKSHDLALIKVNVKFKQSVTWDGYYRLNTVCLPNRNVVNMVEETATFSGYGRINDNKYSGMYSDKVRIGQARLSPYNDCENRFCAYYRPGDPTICQGDSGGPLVQFNEHRAVLIGIAGTSRYNPSIDLPKGLSPCDETKTASFWIVVPNNIDWILKTIESNK